LTVATIQNSIFKIDCLLPNPWFFKSIFYSLITKFSILTTTFKKALSL